MHQAHHSSFDLGEISRLLGAGFPVMALDQAAVAHLVFVDDLPLVIGVGVLQHRAVGS